MNDLAYFVYANARRSESAFDGKLTFEIQVLPYEGDADWVEKKLTEAKECLLAETLPAPRPDCPYCAYRIDCQGYEKIY